MNSGPLNAPMGSVGIVRDRQWVRTLEIPADADAATLQQTRESSWPQEWETVCAHSWLRVRIPRFWRRRYEWTCQDCGARWIVRRLPK